MHEGGGPVSRNNYGIIVNLGICTVKLRTFTKRAEECHAVRHMDCMAHSLRVRDEMRSMCSSRETTR